jgi:hypothetical protein
MDRHFATVAKQANGRNEQTVISCRVARVTDPKKKVTRFLHVLVMHLNYRLCVAFSRVYLRSWVRKKVDSIIFIGLISKRCRKQNW